MTDVETIILNEIRDLKEEVKSIHREINSLKIKWSVASATTGAVVTIIYHLIKTGS